METVQSKIVRNSKSSYSTVSYINATDINELSKEKEEELLFGVGEDGDDEETLSDDSLRLRLSDDEDANQEEQSAISVTMERNLCPNPKQVAENITRSGNGELRQNKHNSEKDIMNLTELKYEIDLDTENNKFSKIAIAPNNTKNYDVIDGDMCEVGDMTNNISYSLNLHKNFVATNDIEGVLIPNINNLKSLNNKKKIKISASNKIKMKRNNKEIFQDISNDSNNELLLTHANHDDIVEVEILNNNTKTKDNEVEQHASQFDEEKIESSNVYSSVVSEVNSHEVNSEKNILENDNASANGFLETSSCRDGELIIHDKNSLKQTVSNSNEISAIDNRKLNNLTNIDSNSSYVDSIKFKVYNTEKLSTVTSFSNNNDDNLKIFYDKLVAKIITNNVHCVICSLVKINHSQNSTDGMKSNSLEDSLPFCKDFIEHKSTKRSVDHKDRMQKENAPKTQFMQQEASTTLVQDQNDITKIKDKTKVINENNDINEHVSQTVDNNSSSTKCISLASINVENSNDENDNKHGTIIQRRKRSERAISIIQNCAIEEDKQEGKESGRQKRRTAKNAEEIIRKEYLNNKCDSNDIAGQFVTSNHKLNQRLHRSSSSSSLKRNCSDNENVLLNGDIKKVKISPKLEGKNVYDITNLNFVEKFFQGDIKEKLPKLTQQELEELLIQKIVETITMRSEIGQLREQARISEKNQEATRAKLQQLTKQIKDFEMVLNRNKLDRHANPDKFVAPIKINRSVGLQVNFLTEHGMQNLRQVQQSSHLKSANIPSTISSSISDTNDNIRGLRRGLKIRSPRRSETSSTASTSTISQSPIQAAPLISTVTPAALVVANPVESQHTLMLPNQPNNVQQLLSAQQQMQAQSHQTIVLNGKLQNQMNRQNTALIAPRPRNNDLIDLTDEEEKSKSNMKIMTVTSSMVDQPIVTKSAQCFPKVIQTIPANVAIANQPTSIRVVQSNQPTPAALVNNINSPRLTYVMQSSVGSTRQLLITSNANQIRPATTCSRSSFSAITYKPGISTNANGTVRVLTTAAVPSVQHPAPLPETPVYTMTPGWKLPPPAPSLKISKVANGIVLSWNMILSDKYADIASYQLYAYQEVVGVIPNTTLWKKVGDVRALPLPMACTLTQFSEGNNYYFAVRAVDTYSRKGQYSMPGNISL